MIHLVIVLVLVLAAAAGSFCGLLVCSCLDGGYTYGNPMRDFLKCLVVSLVAVIPAWALLVLIRHPGVVAPFPVVWYIGVRLGWLELEKTDIVVIGLATLLSIGIAVAVLLRLLAG